MDQFAQMKTILTSFVGPKYRIAGKRLSEEVILLSGIQSRATEGNLPFLEAPVPQINKQQQPPQSAANAREYINSRNPCHETNSTKLSLDKRTTAQMAQISYLVVDDQQPGTYSPQEPQLRLYYLYY